MRLEKFFTVKKIIIALSLLCYFMACVFPPFHYSDMAIDDFFGGLFCVLFGWAGILFHQGFLKIYFLAWYSNITYIFAIRYLIKSKYKRFCICSLFTLGLSFLFAFCPEVIIDEAGHKQKITMAAGYYLWVASFFILLIGGIYILFEKSKKKELSPNHKRMYPLDNQGHVDLCGKFIKSIKHIHKFIKCDFSNSSFATSNAIYWIKNKTFIDSVFSNTTFNALAEHGNKFCCCIFENINFKNTILGYDSSCYTNCVFKKVKFGAFIKPQFKDCKFIDCDFYNVDLQASSFENCEFVGKLENVWFRGGFPTDSLKKEFGFAKPNKMLNVSFENAILHDITFSDNCDLSTIILPKQGQYLFFDNWDEQLNMILEKGTTNQPVNIANDIASFVTIYKVHSENQKYYILNIEDLLREYSEKSVEIIRQNATQKAGADMPDKYCRICGFKLRFSPWGKDNNTPTYYICPCCGAEFGYDDYTPKSIKAYREKWIKSGAKWFDSKMKPENWNIEDQLHNCINIK